MRAPALIVAIACAAASGVAAQEPEPDRVRVRALVEAFIAGNAGAAEELLALGPSGAALARDVFPRESWHKLRELVGAVARAELARSAEREPGLLYRGQFSHLGSMIPEVVDTLLALMRNEDEEQALRVRAGNALGDLVLDDTSRERLREALREICADFLSEPWFEQEAGYLLARLGDRSYIDPLIAHWSEVAKEPATAANVGHLISAHAALAEVYYRVGDYPAAIQHYQLRAVILEGLRERVRPELVPTLEQDLALLRYNTACSQSLAGRFGDAFRSLDQAIAHADITLEMVARDGDLRALRAAPQFADWLEKARAARAAPPEKPAEAPEAAGPPEPAGDG